MVNLYSEIKPPRPTPLARNNKGRKTNKHKNTGKRKKNFIELMLQCKTITLIYYHCLSKTDRTITWWLKKCCHIDKIPNEREASHLILINLFNSQLPKILVTCFCPIFSVNGLDVLCSLLSLRYWGYFCSWNRKLTNMIGNQHMCFSYIVALMFGK